jgi:hypothetical protein
MRAQRRMQIGEILRIGVFRQAAARNIGLAHGSLLASRSCYSGAWRSIRRMMLNIMN